MEVATLGLKVDGSPVDKASSSLDRFSRSADKAERSSDGLQNSSRTTNKSLADAARSSDRAASSLSGLADAARIAGAAMAAIGVGAFASSTFQAVRSAQQLQASLKTVTGSVQEATVAWGNLLAFAEETPFTLEQSVQGFIRMKSLGLDPTNEALRSFGNTASAMGKDMMQMVEAVADATTGEFERLKEFGIRASREGDQVSFTFQGVTTTVRNSSEAISKYLQDIGENQFAGAMADQMDTLGGKVSNLEDSIYQFYLAVGEAGATDAFSSALSAASSGVEILTENVDTLVDGVQVLSALVAGRLAGSFSAAAAAQLAATQQSIAYQAALARMAGVSRVAATAQVTMAAAVRGASAAMSVVGGPVGVAVLAAAAIFAYREELGRVPGPANRATQALDGLTDALNDNSEAAIKNRLSEITVKMSELESQASAARAELENINKTSTDPGPFRNSMVLGRDAPQRAEQYKQLQDANEQMDVLAATAEKLEGQLSDLGTTERGLTDNTRDATDNIESLANAAGKAKDSSDRFESSLQSLMDTLFPLQANLREYQEDQALLNQAYDQGLISLDQYTEGLKRLHEQRLLSQDRPDQAYDILAGPTGMGQGEDEEQGGWDQWLESAQVAFTDFDSLAASTAENFQRGFGDAFESMIFDSQNFGDAMYNLFDGIARTLVSALGEMAAQWLAYQAVQLLVGNTTQASAAATQAANAQAMSQMAGLNAFASTAAIPIVGPVLAPAAMAAALAVTQPIAASIAATSYAGAFDNGGTIPAGQWGIAGERGPEIIQGPANVTSRRDTAAMLRGGGDSAPASAPVINVTNNGEPKQATARSRMEDGKMVIDILLEDLAGDGRYITGLRKSTNVQRRGR